MMSWSSSNSIVRRSSRRLITSFLFHYQHHHCPSSSSSKIILNNPNYPHSNSNWVHQEQRRHKWEGKGSGDGYYDHIRADMNCPRCSKNMSVIFSNRPL